jgi:crossover junction endodeoxyribonuclease RusA
MSDSVTIVIPMSIPTGLSPNSRLHWGPRSRLVREAREAAYYATRQAFVEDDGPIPAGPLVLHVLIALEARRRTQDDDNAWAGMKAFRDGLADALAIDDKHLRCGSITQTRDPEKRGYIKIAVERAAEEQTA